MNPSRSFGQKLSELSGLFQPGLAFLVLIFGALIAFEMFNYSTTDHALQDLLGTLQFGSFRWSTILALAFCGIDFAGIARLFTPEQGQDEPKEVWYLFGAWLLAATMNAILTWWGVSMAIVNHPVQSAAIVDPKTISTIVPVFVAVMVWVIRILIIGTLSVAMDRMLHPGERRAVRRPMFNNAQPALTPRPAANQASLAPRQTYNRPAAPEPRVARPVNDITSRAPAAAEPISRGMPEPTYHSLSAAPRNAPTAQGDRPGAAPSRRL